MIYRFILLLLTISCSFTAEAQPVKGAFSQKLDVRSYAGKTAVLSASVRVLGLDYVSGANLTLAVQDSNGKVGRTRLTSRLIKDWLWKRYEVSIFIEKDADSLLVGGMFQDSGLYHFDDFKLTVGNTEVALQNSGFENGVEGWKFPNMPVGVHAKPNAEATAAGKFSLLIDASGGRLPYGYYEKAGNWAQVNGTKLYYEIYGAGPPLLLLHGNRQSITAFSYNIPELSKKYKVIAVDSRGQGHSAITDATYSYDLFAADMNALLDHLKLKDVRIVGWSDGGNTGLIMAMKYPKKVKALVTMGANIFPNEEAIIKEVFPEVEKLIKWNLPDTTLAGRSRVGLLKMLLTEPNYKFEDLKVIKCPVLVVAGEHDLILLKHTKGIADAIPKGKMYIAPGKKHEFPSNDPAGFNKLVLDFFASQK